MLLSFQNVSFHYNKSIQALKNITFNLNEGEKVALLGLNGSGKSTLMLQTNGLLLPSEGNVVVKGMDTRSKSLREIRKIVGLVFQNPDEQLFMHTVKDDVAFGPRNMKLPEKVIEERVVEAMRVTNTLELSDRHPFDLSGGQKKSVSIATVLSMRAELIVMDEPTSDLDYKATNNFIDIALSLPQAMLISTHDMDLAKKVCSRAIVLDKGRLIYDGSMQDVRYPEKISG